VDGESGRPGTPRWVEVLLVLVVVGFLAYVAWVSLGSARRGRPVVPAGRPVEVWYADPTFQFLVPAVKRVGAQFMAGMPIPQVAMELLKTPPAGLLSPLPGQEAPLIMVAAAAQATVQIALPASVGASQERLLIGAVVRTLTSLPEIRSVRILAVDAAGRPREGHEDTSKPFTARSAEVRNAWDSPGTAPITVWFKLAGSRYLLPLDMAPPVADGPIEAALTALAGGPPRGVAGLAPAVPEEAGLRFVGQEGTTLRVEWTRPDVPADPGAQDRLITATVLTLTELPGTTRVRFESPAGPLARRVGPYDLLLDVAGHTARAALEIKAAAPSPPPEQAS